MSIKIIINTKIRKFINFSLIKFQERILSIYCFAYNNKNNTPLKFILNEKLRGADIISEST